jgi:hypothetical protein
MIRLWASWIVQLAHISFRGAHTAGLQPRKPLSANLEKMLIL